MLSMNHTFTFSQKPMISLDVTAFYKSRSILNMYEYKSLGGVDAGIKWKFLKNHAILSFAANDIFKSSVPVLHQRIGTQWQDIDTRRYNRNVSLTFTYKFHNFKEKDKKDVDLSRMGVK